MSHAGRLPRYALAIAFGMMAWGTIARAEIIDQIAAVVEGQVITTGDVERLSRSGLVPRREGEQDTEYRRRVLDTAIEFLLQRRDAERFGLKDVRPADIDARIDKLARLSVAGTDETKFRQIIRQRLQIEAYIEERFAPLIFISLDEIERYYRETWSRQRLEEGQPIPPLAEVREQLRELLRAEGLDQEVRRWTERLRSRANVDVYAFQ